MEGSKAATSRVEKGLELNLSQMMHKAEKAANASRAEDCKTALSEVEVNLQKRRRTEVSRKCILSTQLSNTMNANPIPVKCAVLYPAYKDLPDREGTLQAKIARFDADATFLLNAAWLMEQSCEITAMGRRFKLFNKPEMVRFRGLFDEIRDFNQPEKEKEVEASTSETVAAPPEK